MSSPSGPRPAGVLSDELRALAPESRRKKYRAGEVIFSAGDAGDGFHIVETGQVRISAVVGPNEPRTLATIGPGDFFGEMAVVDEAPRSATATAETATTTLFVGRDILLRLLEKRPHLALNLLREFSARMRALNRKYVDEILQAERLAVVGRFAGTIVHDFKNPLTIIGLTAEMLCDADAPDAIKAKAKRSITRQIDRMTNMLQELIEFTKPSGQRPDLQPTPFADFMQPLAEELREEIAARHVKLEAGTPPQVLVRIDPRRLSRLFYNLVNNAVDELPDGGRVTLRYKPSRTELRIEVEDTGNGIAPEIAASLFQPFATHGKKHGTGLGLTICRKIVEDHGGKIGVAPSEPGKGALFYFTLPLGD